MSILEGPRREIKLYLLHHRFEILALECPRKTALIFEGGTEKAVPIETSYEDLNDISNQIARIIIKKSQKNNSKPNEDGDYIVAVCLNASDKLIKILLGIWKTRATYLPLSPNCPKTRIQYIIQDAKPILVICEDNMNTEVFKDTPVLKISELFNLVPLGETSNVSLHEVPPNFNNDVAIVLYTSGSSGVPKGVRLPHFAIQNRLDWQWKTFPYLNLENHAICKTDLTFVDSISEIWGPLLSGLTLVIVSSEIRANPERLLDVLERYNIRRLVLVPCQLRVMLATLFLQRGRQRLPNLKIWICSGDALPANLVKSFYDYFPESNYTLHNFYGSTELMGDVTYFTCKSKKQTERYSKIPIGIPINNTVIYILDAELKPVNLGEVGEIVVSGLNVAVGYTNDSTSVSFLKNHLTENRIYSRIFRTGDYGSIQNGVLMYEGRSDSQIKIRGNRVNLLDIERSALSLDFVDNAAVVCYQRGEVDQTPIAFLKLKNLESNLSGPHIQSILKEKLPEYMIPHAIIVNSIPFLQNGKIDRKMLMETYDPANISSAVSQESNEFDLSDVPKGLQKTASDFYMTIAKVLGTSTAKTMKLSSNFYEIGGDSLNSICAVSLLREQGYNINIQDFISAGSVDEIVSKMRRTSTLPLVEQELDNCLRMSIEVSPLQMNEKEVVSELIATSFYEKGCLDQWLKPGLSKNDYMNLVDGMWNYLVEKNLSFSLKNEKGEIIAAAINYDEDEKPNKKLTGKLIYILNFLDQIEKPIIDKMLPKGRNKILHSFIMGTSKNLNDKENIIAMSYMEKETLMLAKRKNFVGVLTTNTNPLSQQLGLNVYKYKVMLEYQVNQYKHPDGSRPFGRAPNSQKAVVQWKEVTN